MSKIIDLSEYKRKKLIQNRAKDDLTDDELFSILMGVISSTNAALEDVQDREMLRTKKDFEKYKDDAGDCRCLFCGSVLLEKENNEN